MTLAAFQSGQQDRWLAAKSNSTEAVSATGGRRVRVYCFPERLENEVTYVNSLLAYFQP